MIEELTPKIMMSLMLLLILTASILTPLLSALLLWLYQRKVTLKMASMGGYDGPSPGEAIKNSPQPSGRKENRKNTVAEGSGLSRQALRAPWRCALRLSIAGLLFALVFALAAHVVLPTGLKLPGFFIGVWIYTWPLFLTLPLIVPVSVRHWALIMLAYFMVFALLGAWAATVKNLPEYRFGGFFMPARSSVTPMGMVKLWLLANSAPTLLAWFCFIRRIRAVAPLVLAFVVVCIGGLIAGWLGLFSKSGTDAVVTLSVSWDLHVGWFLLAALILALACLVVFGWLLIRCIAVAYCRRWLSDQSLTLDAFWLLFGSFYDMWLMQGGVMWIATLPAAFLVFRTVLEVSARIHGTKAGTGSGLIFLRVFSLGRRSDTLLNLVAMHWRYLGSIQMITGPDVARSTVQPHQFLDFISGKLTSHFVSDPISLNRCLAGQDHAPDPDNRYRINNFFCYKDSWKPALLALVREGGIVLMDLRSFSYANAGCIHELQMLIREVPMDRCLLVVDDTTDEVFLENTLTTALAKLTPDAPNRDRTPREMTLVRFEQGTTQVHRLIHQLCLTSAR